MTEQHNSGRLDATLKNRGFDTSKQGYETSLGFYGGKVKVDNAGRTYLDMKSGDIVDFVDRAGDKRVRSTDDHVANAALFGKNALRVWKNRTTGVLESLRLKSKSQEQQAMDATWASNKSKWDNKEAVQKVGSRSILKAAVEAFKNGHSMRYRGTLDEINKNIVRLGLEDYYGSHANGIEFKHPEIYTNGVSLLDVVLAAKTGKAPLEEIDQKDAFAKTAKYVREVHDNHGAVGELLPADIQFQKHEGSTVSDPVLGLPDIVWNENATFSDTAKKATDVLDFLVSTSFGLRSGGKTPDEIKQILDTFIESYGDEKVIRAVRAFVNPTDLDNKDRMNKKLTLPGEKGKGVRFVSTWHNSARLGANKQFASEVRNEIFSATEKYLPPLPKTDNQGSPIV